MIFRAFMDESIGGDGTFVMGGHIADVASWASFAAEWKKMLPLAVMAEDGSYQFKMSEMATTPERMARVPGFFRIIEKHVKHSLSCRINVYELERARARIFVPGINIGWSEFSDPYFAAFRALMDFFHARRANIQQTVNSIPADAVIDFYFDDHTKKKTIRAVWDRYIAARPTDLKGLYGAEPRFENDRVFLPLQGADLWAWWVRKWCADGRLIEQMQRLDFGIWKGKGIPRTHISIDEEQWVINLADIIAPQVPITTPIFDVKIGKAVRLGERAVARRASANAQTPFRRK